MKVFELMIDMDCTTRSQLQSFGLYSTHEKAEEELKRLKIRDWQRAEIHTRPVQ